MDHGDFMKRLLILGFASLSALSMENPGTVTNRKTFKKEEAARRLFMALPYYRSLTSYYDGAVTESDSDADLPDCNISPEQQEQNRIKRAQEKYDAEVARTKQQRYFNAEIADALNAVDPSKRVDVYERIQKASGYEADCENDAIMSIVVQFKGAKKTRSRDW